MRLIKPNLIASHDWHVQPICQRSLRMIRLSGILWDRGSDCDARVVLELDALAGFCRLNCGYRRFCANFLRLSKFRLSVKLKFDFFFVPRELLFPAIHRHFHYVELHSSSASKPIQKVEAQRAAGRAAQNLKQRPAQNCSSH